MKTIRIGSMLSLSLLLTIQLVVAQNAVEPKPANPSSEKDKSADARLAFMFDSTASYVGKRESDGAEITIFPQPLLRWTNPNHGTRDGIFVAWVDKKNRPMAAGQVFLMPNTDNDWYIEHQSLCDGLLNFESKNNTKWTPRQPGVKWTKSDGDMIPAGSDTLRLTQIRQLARRFRGENNLVAPEDQLRLMTTPMVRYADEVNGIIDGALFAMVQGTDPELLIQIEARNNREGRSEYWWAMSAMTSSKLDGFLDDKHVYSKEQSAGSPTSIFYMHRLSGGVPFPAK